MTGSSNGEDLSFLVSVLCVVLIVQDDGNNNELLIIIVAWENKVYASCMIDDTYTCTHTCT